MKLLSSKCLTAQCSPTKQSNRCMNLRATHFALRLRMKYTELGCSQFLFLFVPAGTAPWPPAPSASALASHQGGGSAESYAAVLCWEQREQGIAVVETCVAGEFKGFFCMFYGLCTSRRRASHCGNEILIYPSANTAKTVNNIRG